jgi:hypothetical protein
MSCLSPHFGQAAIVLLGSFVRSLSPTTLMWVPHLQRQVETVLIIGIDFASCPAHDANRKGDGHGSRRPFLPAIGQFVGVRNTPVIPNNLPLGTKVRMSGALWKSHSHRNDNFSPTADIFIHAELKVGFPICRHYLNVRRESLQKQHGNFMCDEWYLPAMRSNQLIEWRMSRFRLFAMKKWNLTHVCIYA